ncbi:MAG: Mg-protoporphyrin IX monomethyl ester oxidative cyclase [Nitrospinae bacterium CG11_big_fil_rev_8_21_14_0_20_56_8]|nr:MAG: Mg-protoporphyrin IX monomethyl ester oxidative cyclase [Nitrospinae bacterium CG11_big_fil_rev_8_21_14_0_20_56_8]
MDRSIGIVTLNAKFIHSSISLRYLRNAARNAGFNNVWIQEFIINQPTWKIAAEILRLNPDVLGLSVYIWNRMQILELAERLMKQRPSLKIVLGGPEVSFDPPGSFSWPVISGEGETKWVEFLQLVRKNIPPSPEILDRWNTYGNDLPALISPFSEEDFDGLRGRIVYIETSRGCPYLCSFCLSALDKTVRYFDDAVIRHQIQELVDRGVRQIKFVDRTFNLKPGRLRNWMEWLTRFPGTSFHFEVVGDILNADLVEFLETVPEGMFQFEIGIQTATPGVQETIRRRQDNDRLFSVLDRLVRQSRVHIHCDLIFGLPGETLPQILNSFERVFSLRPHELQLGFLKFLPGAPIRDQIEPHQYDFQSSPPYELICNKDLSADGVIHLKKFTEVFDEFYNSKRFRFSLDRLLLTLSPVEIFTRLLQTVESRDFLIKARSLDIQYDIFLETFSCQQDAEAMDRLRLDYLYSQRVLRLPDFLRIDPPRGVIPPQKTWPGDRKTPFIPFNHRIEIEGFSAHLTPVFPPVFYAIAHPETHTNYISPPRLHLATAEKKF